MKRIDEEFERLRDGRDLTPFEESAVYAVARLIIELEQASQQVLAEGVIIDDGRGVSGGASGVDGGETLLVGDSRVGEGSP